MKKKPSGKNFSEVFYLFHTVERDCSKEDKSSEEIMSL
jgi:hypothetical protein